MAHGHKPGAEYIAHAALAASATLDSEGQILYADFILAALQPLARAALKQLMSTNTDPNPFFSEEFRERWVRAISEGEAKMLLRFIRYKGFRPSPEQQARIEASHYTQLEAWSERLPTADTLDDMFRDS